MSPTADDGSSGTFRDRLGRLHVIPKPKPCPVPIPAPGPGCQHSVTLHLIWHDLRPTLMTSILECDLFWRNSCGIHSDDDLRKMASGGTAPTVLVVGQEALEARNFVAFIGGWLVGGAALQYPQYSIASVAGGAALRGAQMLQFSIEAFPTYRHGVTTVRSGILSDRLSVFDICEWIVTARFFSPALGEWSLDRLHEAKGDAMVRGFEVVRDWREIVRLGESVGKMMGKDVNRGPGSMPRSN